MEPENVRLDTTYSCECGQDGNLGGHPLCITDSEFTAFGYGTNVPLGIHSYVRDIACPFSFPVGDRIVFETDYFQVVFRGIPAESVAKNHDAEVTGPPERIWFRSNANGSLYYILDGFCPFSEVRLMEDDVEYVRADIVFDLLHKTELERLNDR